MDTKPHILIIDGDAQQSKHILSILQEQDYQFSLAESGEIAYNWLSNEPDKYDVILSDEVLPDTTAVALIKKMNDLADFYGTIIIQSNQIEGLDADVQYHLSKPVEPKTVISTVANAVRHHISYKHRVENRIALGLLQTAEFKFQTLSEAHAVASLLSDRYPEPSKVITGLTELMINAVEHGNLEIDYAGKTKLTQSGELNKEIQRRLGLPEYKSRVAIAKLQVQEKSIELTVKDEGNGFDWHKYMEFDTDRLMDPHGRGIAISNKLCFNELNYKGCGNEVVAIYHL